MERMISSYYKDIRDKIREEIKNDKIASSSASKYDHILLNDKADFSVFKDRPLGKEITNELYL